MWVLPTWGRPGRCQDALDSIAAAGTTTPGVVIVDGDRDPAYTRLRLPAGWCTEILPANGGLHAALNHAAFTLYPAEPWYGIITDDSIVRTAGWDVRLVTAAGRCGMAYSNDGDWRCATRMAGACVFGGDMVRALGWWGLRYTFHAFGDDAWESIGRAAGNLTYCADVLVEHCDVEAGKARPDATYYHSYSRLEQDRAGWVQFLRNDLSAAIARVRALMARNEAMS